jgi:uncharacterized protein with ParB-like and HNH nuclease domain/predicted transport protein
MKASEIRFLEFLRQADQLTIPIYQRPYSWGRRQWEQLWSDITRAAKVGEGHFIGSIVYILGDEGEIGRVNPAQVIDGQQRLTTISLLLTALARHLEGDGARAEMTGQRLRSRYLVNRDEEGEDRYKLILTKTDKDTLLRLLDGYDPPSKSSPRILAAYGFFETELRRTLLSPDQVFAGLERLMTVGIALDRRYDNAQLIFESLNSTGLDLSEADRIRNFVLMDLPRKDQTAIYQASWYPMEELFRDAEDTAFDRFIRDYLTLKTGQIPKINQVYEAFKAYARTTEHSRAALVNEVYHFAKHWVRLALEGESDPEIRAAIADINRLRVDVAYPFLLDVLDDHEQGKINRSQLLAVLRLVESYVFRRAICAIPTNTLNKVFAGLSREVDEQDYMQSLFAAILLKESYTRMPTDEEFQTQFVLRDVYNFRSRNYLLDKLENHDRKEAITVEDYTIEHVMPQNPELSPEWQQELGPDWHEVHDRLLHTIGNLTLTGYNPELSDRPFQEKLSMKGGFRDSPLRLNRYIAELDHWNQEAIERRAQMLAKAALRLWPAPSIPETVLATYRRSKASVQAIYTLEDHPELKGPVGPLFEDLRRRVLNLESGVNEEVRKRYIAYKFAGNFLGVVPLKTELKLYLAATVEELTDPKELTRDVRGIGHWATGDTEVRLSSADQLNAVMALVRQALDRQLEQGPQETSYSEAAVEELIEQAADPDIQQAARAVVEAAVRNNLYPRPWKRSLMFTPPTNRTRALFTLALREDGRVQLAPVPEAFETFFKLDPRDIERQLGPGGWQTLDITELRSLADRIDEVMADAQTPSDRQEQRPWNGRDFYVVLGGRDWDDCQRFGFVSAGGGRYYSKPLEQLYPGARVFAYMPGQGYVGVGQVLEPVRPVTEFQVEVDGERKPILEAPFSDAHLERDKDDPERCEYLVRVDWLATRPLEEAVWDTGLFANQMTVCKLRDQVTIDFVLERLGLAHAQSPVHSYQGEN